MRVIVTGGAGLLGTALVECAPDTAAVDVTIRTRPAPPGVSFHRLDLAEPGAFHDLLRRIGAEVVIHTAYDKSDLDRGVVDATTEVAKACARHGASLVHVSTDAVFDGERAPYVESDPPTPVHPYGEAKARAETIVSEQAPDAAIVRTSLLLSDDPIDPTSSWVVESARQGRAVTLFTDEVRTPVAVRDVAAGIWRLVGLDRVDRAGVWHLGGAERLNRLQLGLVLAARHRFDPRLLRGALSTSMPGPRPRDASLRSDRAVDLIKWCPRTVSAAFGLGAMDPDSGDRRPHR